MYSAFKNDSCLLEGFTSTIRQVRTVRQTFLRRMVPIIWALLAMLLAPMASAQRLDDVWFKLRFTGKGRTLDDAGRVEKLTVSAPIYLHFISMGAQTYSVDIWVKIDNEWSNTTTSQMETLGANENIISDWGEALHGPQGSTVHVYCTFYVSVNTNKTGAITSGVFDGGGEIDDGMIALENNGAIQYNHYYGTCTIKGTVVKQSKLPFSP